MCDFPADFSDCFFQAGQLRRQAPARFVRAQVILRLVLGTFEVVADRFQFFEGHIDRAILAAREKQRALPHLEIFLDRSPPGSANTQAGSGNMCGDLAILQSMEVFEFVETKREHVVIERLGSAANEPFECSLITGFVARIQRDCPACMPSRFTLQAKASVAHDDVEAASMRATIDRVVALGIAPLLEAEKHRPNERHQRAFAGFVRPVKYVESRIQRSPVLIGPDSESINVDVFNSHCA